MTKSEVEKCVWVHLQEDVADFLNFAGAHRHCTDHKTTFRTRFLLYDWFETAWIGAMAPPKGNNNWLKYLRQHIAAFLLFWKFRIWRAEMFNSSELRQQTHSPFTPFSMKFSWFSIMLMVGLPSGLAFLWAETLRESLPHIKKQRGPSAAAQDRSYANVRLCAHEYGQSCFVAGTTCGSISPPNFHSMSTSWFTIRVCLTASRLSAA